MGSSEDIHRPVKQTETSVSSQTQVDALNEKVTQMQKNMIEMQAHTKQVRLSSNLFFEHSPMLILFFQQMMIGMDWMIKAMARVKMSSEQLPSMEFSLSPSANRNSATTE